MQKTKHYNQCKPIHIYATNQQWKLDIHKICLKANIENFTISVLDSFWSVPILFYIFSVLYSSCHVKIPSALSAIPKCPALTIHKMKLENFLIIASK